MSGPPEDEITATTEIERKFDVATEVALPDLTGLPGVVEVTPPHTDALDATYFDTADLRLTRNGITLRRRTGGSDAGWHLKLPRTDGERQELATPLGRATRTVPAHLRPPIEVHLRGRRPIPIVRLQTLRATRNLVGADHSVLAEIAIDDVTATTFARARHPEVVQTWQEIEVELKSGDRALLDAVVQALVDAGAQPSAHASKLARAVGDRPPPAAPPLRRIRRRSAAAALLSHLSEHIAVLTTQDPLVRADHRDAVHQMRVATRRLRSALSTYRPLVDRAVTDPIRDELQWLGEALGAARDAEVIRAELHDLVNAQPADLIHGPVAERIDVTLGARYRAAHDEVLATLLSRRYFTLLDRLDRLRADPPLSDAAHGPADAALLPLVAHTFTRTRRLVTAARAERDPERHDQLLHDVRKAAKRARYAGESLIATYGKPARRWTARMEAIQESLGEHQDSIVVRGELLTLAAAARDAGEDTFTYGRLHGLEEARADATEHRFDAMWARATAPGVHRWLTR